MTNLQTKKVHDRKRRRFEHLGGVTDSAIMETTCKHKT